MFRQARSHCLTTRVSRGPSECLKAHCGHAKKFLSQLAATSSNGVVFIVVLCVTIESDTKREVLKLQGQRTRLAAGIWREFEISQCSFDHAVLNQILSCGDQNELQKQLMNEVRVDLSLRHII